MTCKSLCKQHTNFTQFWQISTTKTCDWHIRMFGSGSGKIIPIWPDPDALHCLQPLLTCPYTVWKEIKWSEILYELVRDTTCKSEKHELICAVSWTNLCSISESPSHIISFLTVYGPLLWGVDRLLVKIPNVLQLLCYFANLKKRPGTQTGHFSSATCISISVSDIF